MKRAITFISIIALLFSILSICLFAKGSTFIDIDENAWYSEYVADCFEKGLMIGTTEKTFEPNTVMTRAMFVQTLYNYYINNIYGTEYDLNHLNNKSDYEGGYVGTITEVNSTYPFTLEQQSVILIPSGDDYVEKEVIYKSTREDLISGSIDGGIYATDIVCGEGIISFQSMDKLTIISDSSNDLCSISMSGGQCYASAFSGCAERVEAHSDMAKIEAVTPEGSDFEIKLCDLGSRTGVVIKGKSSGNLKAHLSVYDLTVEGAVGEYSVDVYAWAWDFGALLKSYSCDSETVLSNVLPFSDIDEGAYYIEALKWATHRKLIKGISTTVFDPDGIVTREQIATLIDRFLYRFYYGYSKYDLTYNFSDEQEISYFAKSAVESAAKSGLMVGDGSGRFNPKASATRAEVAKVFSTVDDVIRYRIITATT